MNRGPVRKGQATELDLPVDWKGHACLTEGRQHGLVEWQPDARPRLLTTAADIQQARQAGDVAVSEPGIVVNMPITTWPGGQR